MFTGSKITNIDSQIFSSFLLWLSKGQNRSPGTSSDRYDFLFAKFYTYQRLSSVTTCLTSLLNDLGRIVTFLSTVVIALPVIFMPPANLDEDEERGNE